MKLSEFPTKSTGIGKVSVTFSTAKIGSPAVIFPIIVPDCKILGKVSGVFRKI